MEERLSRRFDLSSHMGFMARNLNGMLPTYTRPVSTPRWLTTSKAIRAAGSDDADRVVA
jgi:hypothetical protein